jgi:hypothetical protein
MIYVVTGKGDYLRLKIAIDEGMILPFDRHRDALCQGEKGTAQFSSSPEIELRLAPGSPSAFNWLIPHLASPDTGHARGPAFATSH